ncbi:ABC transporter substrate-binding protein [Labedaea rhizosphaerae]|uniref:Polar amino acid transport system substrate-binding protein n=1 Tax=Labedaea rhizosphaerae TaxID=598644 RepID=A0A4R6SMQ4_LABRH|nr:ABC transporter substrate-binding protein [Labedaea rhizosphaerae]TDQ05287.1 polar amino acid transport system substrate-binding protein [Labedaea rhizosphaerae]
MSRRARLSAIGLLCAVTAALSVACGASTDKPGAQNNPGGAAPCTPGAPVNAPPPQPLVVEPQVDAAIAAKVPSAVKSKGTLKIATDASYAPNEFIPEGSSQIVGMDVDLGQALAKKLGLKAEFVNATFDGLIAGTQSHRFDLIMSSMTDSKEREKTIDFVTYFQAGTSTMVVKCNPKGIKADTDLCGKNVGAENGTVQLDALTKEDADGSIVKICKDAGKPAPVGKGFPKQTDVNAALAANRIDAYMADTPVVDYAVKITGNAFEKVGDAEGVAPYGIGVPKDAGTFKDALADGMNALIADGTYKKILDNWGVGSGAIEKSVVNGAQ